MKPEQAYANVPLTVASAQVLLNRAPNIAIGQTVYNPTSTPTSGGYWFLVVDRTSLQVAVNLVSTDSDNVPEAVQPYVNNTQFMLFLATWGVTINNVPQGALYDLLVAAGAGPVLSRLEQLNYQLGCGLFGNMSYAMAGLFGGGQSLSAVEAASLAQNESLGAVLTAQLVPAMIGGQPIYSPMELDS